MSDVRHNIIDIKNNIDKYLINTPVLRFDFIDLGGGMGIAMCIERD